MTEVNPARFRNMVTETLFEYDPAADSLLVILPPLGRHATSAIGPMDGVAVHLDSLGAPVTMIIDRASGRYAAKWLDEINDPELTLAECVVEAKHVGVAISASTLKVQAWHGRIESRKRDDAIVIRRSELHRYLASRTQGRRTDLEEQRAKRSRR